MRNVTVKITDVHKSFGETRALYGASLLARSGEIHAIVGENGSGKSTLAKIISGVILPDRGEVVVAGATLRSPREAKAAGVATIYQEMMLAEDLAIWENLFAGSDPTWNRLRSNAQKRTETQETMNRLAGLDLDPDTRVAELSLSAKQWLVIARALVQKPKVLIFDESSAALDLEATNRLHHEMRALRESGTSVLIVTHRIAELVKIADVATILRDGASVGRLEREDITEENILRLMSAATAHSATGRTGGQGGTGENVLTARGVQLASDVPTVEFSIHAGEIVGLAGLDGAGQAEFIAALAGIKVPLVGTVTTPTGPVINLATAEAAGIAYVSGDRKREGIFPNLSILENFGLALHGRVAGPLGLLNRKTIANAFQNEVKRLVIKFGRETDGITTLSGGNQQKVLIARAFALSPKVILLNDPARGVDIGTKQVLWKHLRDFADAGGAVIYLSTEIEEFFDFADRACVFFDRRIFAELTGEDINEERILAAMFGRNAPAVFTEIPHAEHDTSIRGFA